MDTKKVILIVMASVAATLAVVFLIPRLFAPQTSTRQAPGGQQGQPAPVVDYGPQIAEVKRVLAGNPNDVGALVALGNLYFDSYQARGETSLAAESIRAYERALALRPGDPNVITDLGTMYRANNQTDKAVAAFRKAMGLDPLHSQSRLNLGVTLFYDKGDMKGAKEAFIEFLKVEPTGPQADSIRQMMEGIKE